MKRKLVFIDNMRAVATVLVMMWHLGYGFWYVNKVVSALLHIDERVGVTDTVPKIWGDIVNAIRMMEIDLGRIGVASFFLISGFIVPYSVRMSGGGGRIRYIFS